jgi:ATP-dependent Lhr-like helicase
LSVAKRILPVRVAGHERFIAAEDAARFRDGIGTALPLGVPDAFLEPVADPVTDLVARYARTHGPFVPSDVATRFGLGTAVIEQALDRLVRDRRVLQGEFRPDGHGFEWIDAGVLRRLRSRSLAALRKEIEPAPQSALARFYLGWQGVGPSASRSGSDALFHVIEQLQGAPIPASALERQVLPARVLRYSPSVLDELGAAGEIVWTGAGALGKNDGWICLATAESASMLLPAPSGAELSVTAERIKDALAERGALFFRQIADAAGAFDETETLLALWELVWAGHVTNDTFAPLRALLQGGTRSSSQRGRRGRPARSGPPAGAGRWSLVSVQSDPTRASVALAEQLLTRHGIVTRGIVSSEKISGGFSAIYPVLKAMEESGRCRRGYFIEGLGGAQFALPGAVDRMRGLIEVRSSEATTQVLAATDPANPYGAALPWPAREGSHRAGRKAGALVILVGGELVIYVERGGRSLLSYSADPNEVQPAVDALALAIREGLLGKVNVERADGDDVLDSPFARALIGAGFKPSSTGLRLRA